MEERTDEYCIFSPLILFPEFLCNLIIPPEPRILNCIKLCQGGGVLSPLLCSVGIMTQMDTKYLYLRRRPVALWLFVRFIKARDVGLFLFGEAGHSKMFGLGFRYPKGQCFLAFMLSQTKPVFISSIYFHI